MPTRFPKYVPLFLVSALAVSGCDSRNELSPTAPAPVEEIVLTAEPATIAPEFLSIAGCRGFRPFGARLRIIARVRHDFFFRSSRFHFIDGSGVRFFPTVTRLDPSNPLFEGANPIPTPVTMPTSPPIPLPGATVPVPGELTFEGLLISGTRAFPFFLQFGCGVAPEGTLFGDFDFIDRDGRSRKSQIRARIAG
jgi:hypothetical protein